MKTAVRKFGTKEFLPIEHDSDECVFCITVSEKVLFSAPGEVIFLEDCEGKVRRIESVVVCSPMVTFQCIEVSSDEAREEIGEAAPS